MLLLYRLVSAFLNLHWLPTSIKHKLLIFTLKSPYGLFTFHTTSLTIDSTSLLCLFIEIYKSLHILFFTPETSKKPLQKFFCNPGTV